DRLTVTLPFPVDQVRGTAVTDATGTVHLRNAHTPSGPNGLELRAAELPKGLYLLRLDTENGHRVVKFVKQ
ncbi:MAG: T9SS type A sorting domain-containing protein, partial [Cytophagales bacterium]|nr:T9SS type A sorting domain-containing protein [Cytophagales bacterium]